jgi:hypothetical protein
MPSSKVSEGVALFAALWALAGVVAFLLSVYCWVEYPSADSSSDFAGLLLAIFTGPFYFLWYFLKKGYCGRM